MRRLPRAAIPLTTRSRLLLLTLLLAVPAGAQPAFVPDSVALPGAGLAVAPPATFEGLAHVDAYGAVGDHVLAIRDGAGRLVVVADSLYRQPTLAPAEDGRWAAATMGCGTACWLTWLLDATTGRVSPPIPSLVARAERLGWAVRLSERGVHVLDPFGPGPAWLLPVEAGSAWAGALATLSAEVAVRDGVLTVTADGLPGELRAALPQRAPGSE